MSTSNVSTYTFAQLDTSADAERRPADVLAAAWAQADAIRAQAHADGEAAGYAAGLERAEAEFKTVADALVRGLGQAASALAGTRDELVETLTRQAADISIGISEQIVAGAFEVRPELVIDVTRGALRRLSERHRLTVLVNPGDLERVSDSVEKLRQEMGGIEFMEVQADPAVEPGGAIVQTEYGEIDASVTTQIQRARELVTAALVGDETLQSDGDGRDDAI